VQFPGLRKNWSNDRKKTFFSNFVWHKSLASWFKMMESSNGSDTVLWSNGLISSLKTDENY
jgi:hypothetical protein